MSLTKVLIWFLLVGRVNMASAQSIDSLEMVLAGKNLVATARVDLMNKLSRELSFVNPIRAAGYAQQALKLAIDINYPAGQAYGYRMLSSLFSANGSRVIATEYIHRALSLFSQLDDSAGIANCYVSLGHALRRANRHREELEYNTKAYAIFSRLGIPDRIAVTAHNLGETYLLTGDTAKCRELTLYAIRLNDSLQQLAVLSNCYKVMGQLEAKLGQLAPAEDYFRKVLLLSGKLGIYSQKVATMDALVGLIDINNQQGRVVARDSLLEAAALFCRDNPLPAYPGIIYNTWLAAYAGDKNKTLALLQDFRALTDTVNAQLLVSQANMEAFTIDIYAYFENEMRKLEEKNIIQAQKLKTARRGLAIAMAAGVIFSGLIILLVLTLRKQKKAERVIQQQTEELRELAAHLQELQESERTITAYNIHESLGQKLIVVKLDVSWLISVAEGKQPFNEERAAASLQILDEAIAEVKKIAGALRPPVLDDIGLDVAMKWQLSEYEKKYAVKTSWDAPAILPDLPGEVKTGVYRIFQKMMINACVHAHAKQVNAGLYAGDKELTLVVRDDGQGLDPSDTQSPKYKNLLAIRERCDFLGGFVHVDGSPGTGNKITVRVPFGQDPYAG